MHSLGVVGAVCSAARYWAAASSLRPSAQRRRGVDLGVDVAGFDLEALAILLQRLRPLAALAQGHSQAVVGQPIVRGALERMAPEGNAVVPKIRLRQPATPSTASMASAAAPA